ncbi:hypothetical protein RJ641_010856 [Dillenia turbinata]|uniref:BZIP domain-containing protein n=1 Tax=Dillenia turbinata TaxID=194707 RepID=A0AAN8V4J9_9MAGN
MLSSTPLEENIRPSSQNHHRGSSTSTSSSSSSPSPFSPSSLLQNPRTNKTMEEVWKDINLASLQDNPTRGHHHQDIISHIPTSQNHRNSQNANFRGMILQDFLARPSNIDPPTSLVSSSTTNSSAVYGDSPATVLSLNSIGEFHFLENPLRTQKPVSNVTGLSGGFEALANSSSGLSCFGRKRFSESDSNGSDRRHKRMIKNRESAARSRARKQESLCPFLFYFSFPLFFAGKKRFILYTLSAYTNELELEVAHLMEENARLRREQQQLYVAAAAQFPKKPTLYRSSTAPF